MGGIALAVLFGFALPASAAGRFVHAGGSIQAAIDAASPGDTIFVGPGTYHENVLITKDNLTILARGATLEPPATPGPATPCDLVFADDPTNPGPAANGLCLAGEVDFDTFMVTNPVSNVRIIGLHIDGFEATGIMAVGAENAQFIGNTLTNDGEYGAFALLSTGTRMIGNRASNAGEAGLYVGDSPNANATLIGNDVSDNLFGIFIRDAEHFTVTGNRIHDNCAGLLVLADAPGPAGAGSITGNLVKNNNHLCQIPEDEGGGAIGGDGIGLEGAHDVAVRGNIVIGNTAPPGLGDDEHGGVLVVVGEGGTVPSGNTVRGNIIKHNDPDIRTFNPGDTTFSGNLCDTSNPDGLC